MITNQADGELQIQLNITDQLSIIAPCAAVP